jgi:hypothetical protein
LLKQLNVIGSRGRNWPLHDGKDQLRLISSSAASVGPGEAASRRSTVSRGSNNDVRSHSSSITSATGDRRELSLFQPREEAEQLTPKKNGPLVAPRISAKPPTRNLTDILSGTENEMPPPATPSERPRSPRKDSNEGAPRIGATKNYHPIRLFEDEDTDQFNPEKSVKTNPNKYKHFEFGNGEGAVPIKNLNDRAKHSSQWDFADFSTPAKPKVQVRTQDSRNFGWSEDEVRKVHILKAFNRIKLTNYITGWRYISY